jgi:hypothetical protein
MTEETRETNAVGRIQQTVDETATAIEGIHKSIAELPLDVLGRIGALTRSADDIRDLQDRSITAVYDVVRDVNQRVMGVVSDVLEPEQESRN